MKSALARLEPLGDPEAVERRRDRRRNTNDEAVLQLSDGTRLPVRLADASANGCSVKDAPESLRPGSFVSIGLGDEPLVGAIVRWVRKGRTGMEFLRALPEERAEWHALIEAPL